MKLKLLKEREKFSDIFSATLSNYLQKKFSWSGSVKWGSHGGSNDLNFLVNPDLNLIYPVHLQKNELISLAAEYSFHTNFLKRFAQKTYINLALHPLLRYFFSPEKLHLTNISAINTNFCILPGNHTIRIISTDKRECVVIKKEGFSDVKLKNAVQIRMDNNDLPGPKILSFNVNDSWYVEERIYGLPINRSSNKLDIDKALGATKKFLKRMYEASSRSVNAKDYIKQKFKEIDSAISSLPSCYKKEDKILISNIRLQLFSLVASKIDKETFLKSSQTHGDLQDANILIPLIDDSRDTYIIDWEYASVRCQHYDWFVYGLKSRSPKGLAVRIKELISASVQTKEEIQWYNFKNLSAEVINVLVLLFLIEDFLFRLDDTNIPNLPKKSDVLLTFLQELNTFMKACH